VRRLLLALPLIVVTACGPLYSTPTAAPSSASVVVEPSSTSTSAPAPADVPAPPARVKVVTASGHVTGLPYPASCTVGKAPNGAALPDPGCTPGAASSAVTQANIRTTICVTGYTSRAGVRAAQSETAAVKKTAMVSYASTSTLTNTELDHLVPLELGGSNDVSNLWPQPSDLPGQGFRNTKDDVENSLRAALCRTGSTLKLTDLQSWIASDWTTALHRAGLR
jgi:hypothetical protein